MTITPEEVAKNLMNQIKSEKTKSESKDSSDSKDEKADSQKAAPGPSPEESPVEVEGEAKPEEGKSNESEEAESSDAKAEEIKEEEKAKEVKESNRKPRAERRIDELVGELKAERAEREQDKAKIQSLEDELTKLKITVEKPAKEADQSKKLSDIEKARIEKYLKEDKDSAREDRREMTQDQIEEWIIEDPVAAQEWLAERVVRRREERKADLDRAKADSEAESIIQSQKSSESKVLQKHPDLDFTRQERELMAKGMSLNQARAEVLKINPKAKIIAQIVSEPGAQEKYMLQPNGPELLMQEMESRLSKSKGKSQKESDDDRDSKIAEEAAEAERQRQQRVDEGSRSRRGAESNHDQSEDYKKQLAIFKSMGKTKEDLDRNLARRKAMNLD